jgi:uncharacterized membrane protein YphA (DoxX/SURF4 family)
MENTIIIIQALIGLLQIVGGVTKLFLPYARYTSISAVAWSKEFKPAHLRLLGVLELSGGIGLIVPLFVPSLAILAPLAAVGLALYMSGAIAIHLRRSEYPQIVGILIVFLVPALFVAYGTLVGFAV